MKDEVLSFVDDFLSEMLQGGAAIFAGAGLSVPAGFVDWRELLRPLSKELKIDIDLESDFIAVAQFHVNSNGMNRNKIHTAIINALSPDTEPTTNHKLLAQLPIRHWWTTNYDHLLENALRAAGKIVDVKSSVPQLATTRPRRDATIYKMHGDVERPDEAVVTRDDYERYTTKREPFVTALAGDLVSKTFLFVGFSFTDPNLEQVLSRVRLAFTDNQRRHYAIFRKRIKGSNETNEEFAHHSVRQALVIEDLKRFNIRTLLIDDFDEITELLTVLVNRVRRRTVFVSGSIADYAPWGQEKVTEFADALGASLAKAGTRVATGLGSGLGDAIFSGALREVFATKGAIEDSLLLRPFPQSSDAWKKYREEILSHVGIAVFLFGNKFKDGNFVDADGMQAEFDMAIEQGLVVLPIGATGALAKKLADTVLGATAMYLSSYDADDVETLRGLADHTDDLISLVPKITMLVQKLQRGGAK